MLVDVSLTGAFIGGTMAILSPCSALLLPAFFAYAFKSRRQFAARTGVFLLGLSSLLIPLGMGASIAGKLLLDYRSQSIVIIGLLMIAFGIIEFLGVGFSLIPSRFSTAPGRGGWGSTYATGLVYAFAGFCSGPLLGAVLTMAAGAGSPVRGGSLLFAYAFGMAFPLFILASLWDRYDLASKRWLKGKEISIAGYKLHSTNFITGTLFLSLGFIFLFSSGTLAFEKLYAQWGLMNLSMKIQQGVSGWSADVPDWIWIIGVTAAVSIIYIIGRKRS